MNRILPNLRYRMTYKEIKTPFLIIAIALFTTSCDNNNANESNANPGSNEERAKTEQPENIAQVKPSFSNLDKNVSDHIKSIFDHYIHVKTALVNSNASEAKDGATAILSVIKGFDKSLLPSEQKAAYDKVIGGIKATAESIASTDAIEKQREHFSALSNQAYELAKSFGAGKTIYHEHCPMAFDNKGAMWLSESKEIKNPYYGEKMIECGSVKEVIEK